MHVVDLPESLDVDHRHGDLDAGLGRVQQLREAIAKQGPVRQAGQAVVESEEVELSALLYVVERVADVRGEPVEQLEVFVVEEPHFGGEQREHAADAISRGQRKYHGGAITRREELSTGGRDARIGRDVVA